MSGSENHTQAPRIAIKFGAPSASSSKSTGNRKPGHSQPSSSLGKRPRPQALGGESESEDDAFSGKLETVTTFGARGAQNDRQPREQSRLEREREIQKTRKGGATTREEAQFNGQSKETEPADQDKGIKWGLTVTKKPVDTDKSPAEGEDPESTPKDATNATQEADGQRNTEGLVDVDQDALNALMGKDDGRKKKLVIAGASNTTEEDALKKDFQTAAEVSTLEEYDQIPDGEFGLAMLRGMGFDGKYQGSRSSEVKRKPALLGLGRRRMRKSKRPSLLRSAVIESELRA
ncbi:hypothetical protein PG987_004510 [Apiospora arundinis]